MLFRSLNNLTAFRSRGSLYQFLLVMQKILYGKSYSRKKELLMKKQLKNFRLILIVVLVLVTISTMSSCVPLKKSEDILSSETSATERQALTIKSENWPGFFQEKIDNIEVQFARRFVFAKFGEVVYSDFCEETGAWQDSNGVIQHPVFACEGTFFHVIVRDVIPAVIREDFMKNQVDLNFEYTSPNVSIEIPDDEFIEEIQMSVDLFCDLVPDFHGKRVSSDDFSVGGALGGILSILNPTHYAVRDDGFSQVTYQMTNKDNLENTVLILIYKDDVLVTALFAPSNQA